MTSFFEEAKKEWKIFLLAAIFIAGGICSMVAPELMVHPSFGQSFGFLCLGIFFLALGVAILRGCYRDWQTNQFYAHSKEEDFDFEKSDSEGKILKFRA